MPSLSFLGHFFGWDYKTHQILHRCIPRLHTGCNQAKKWLGGGIAFLMLTAWSDRLWREAQVQHEAGELQHQKEEGDDLFCCYKKKHPPTHEEANGGEGGGQELEPRGMFFPMNFLLNDVVNTWTHDGILFVKVCAGDENERVWERVRDHRCRLLVDHTDCGLSFLGPFWLPNK